MASKKSSRPIGITILMVLAYIVAVLTLIGGITLLFGANFFASLATSYGALGYFVGAGAIVGGIVLIALAVLYYFIGNGLCKGQNWARIVVIVLSALGFIGSIWPINVIGLVINAVIIWYVGFEKKAVAYFR